MHDQVETLQAIRHRHAGVPYITGSLLDSGDAAQGAAIFAQRFDRSPQAWRQVVVELEEPLHRVARIAPEQFIATVTGEHLGAAVGLRDPGAVIGRQGGRVAEGLIVMLRDRRNAVQEVRRRHVIFVVFAAEVSRGEAGVRHFVITLGVEADRVYGRWFAGDLAEHAGHRRAVGTTRQESADALVPRDLFGDALADQVAEAVACRGKGLTVLFVELQWPVALHMRTVAVDQQRMRRRQPAYLPEDGAWRRNHVEVQIVENRLWIKFTAVSRNAVGAIGESEHLAIGPITQRLDGEAVGGQEGTLARRIDNGQGVGTVQLRGEVDTAAVPGFQNFRGKTTGSRHACGTSVPERGGADDRADGLCVACDIIALQRQCLDGKRRSAGAEEASQVNLARESIFHHEVCWGQFVGRQDATLKR